MLVVVVFFCFFFFFFNDTATTEIYTLSLHDALPICGPPPGRKFKAFATSGPSGGFLPLEIPVALLPQKFVEAKVKPGAKTYDILDIPLGLNTFGMMGGMLGAAFVAYDDRRDMVEQ